MDPKINTVFGFIFYLRTPLKYFNYELTETSNGKDERSYESQR